MMMSLQSARTWIGRIDQALVIVFAPLLIVLVVKVRKLENAMTASSQGAVNVAVSTPGVIPMQPLATDFVCTQEDYQPPHGVDKNDPYYHAFN